MAGARSVANCWQNSPKSQSHYWHQTLCSDTQRRHRYLMNNTCGLGYLSWVAEVALPVSRQQQLGNPLVAKVGGKKTYNLHRK